MEKVTKWYQFMTMRKLFWVIIFLQNNHILAQAKIIEVNNEKYQLVTFKKDQSPVKVNETQGEIFLKKDNSYYKKMMSRTISPMDFGAVGDGVTDDSKAVQNAFNFAVVNNISTIELSGDYVYNLKTAKINLPERLNLRFTGAMLKNGELHGSDAQIFADPVQIFENIILSGNFTNGSSVYVEWFGTRPNDITSNDLKNSLESLYRVFPSVQLNQGVYYTKSGNIEIRGLTGISPNVTFVELNTDNNNQHLFHMGKIGASPEERTYDNNFLKSVALTLNSNDKKIHGSTLLLIGACHQAKIEDVKFIANSPNTSLSDQELLQISKDENKINLANFAIAFNGGSELIYLNNIFTLSDVGIYFVTGADFINISNFTTWNGKNGFASVYFRDTTSSNVLFSGNQSWSQGLYGVYGQNGSQYTNFTNVKFENLRIEQLNENIRTNGKVVATSFWFGDYTYIPNIIFENVMLAGTANGFHFGTLQDSRITMKNILVHYDTKVPRNFALEAKFKQNGHSEISMENVSLAPDIAVRIENSNLEQSKSERNKFGSTIISTNE